MSKKGRTVKFEVCIQALPLPSHPGPVHTLAEISEKMHNTRTLIPCPMHFTNIDNYLFVFWKS